MCSRGYELGSWVGNMVRLLSTRKCSHFEFRAGNLVANGYDLVLSPFLCAEMVRATHHFFGKRERDYPFRPISPCQTASHQFSNLGLLVRVSCVICFHHGSPSCLCSSFRARRGNHLAVTVSQLQREHIATQQQEPVLTNSLAKSWKNRAAHLHLHCYIPT